MAQQLHLSACILTVHGKQEGEKAKTFIELFTKGALSGRGTSQKKSHSSSRILVEVQRALWPTEASSATTEKSKLLVFTFI